MQEISQMNSNEDKHIRSQDYIVVCISIPEQKEDFQ